MKGILLYTLPFFRNDKCKTSVDIEIYSYLNNMVKNRIYLRLFTVIAFDIDYVRLIRFYCTLCYTSLSNLVPSITICNVFKTNESAIGEM